MTDQSDATQADAESQSLVDTESNESEDDSTQSLSKEDAKKLRSEASNLRKRLKDAEAKSQAEEVKNREAQEAKAKEDGQYKELLETREKELETLKAQLADRDLKERKAVIAKAHGIPDELLDRIRGNTDEELDEDAKAIAKVLKTRDAPNNDAGEKTPASVKKVDKSKFADPARWGIQR